MSSTQVFTLTLGGRSWTISREELAHLAPLTEWIKTLSGLPFAVDPPACMRPLPPSFISPARIRGTVKNFLRGLERADVFERALLESLSLDGLPFLELEDGRAQIPMYPQDRIGKSRVTGRGP